MEYSKGAYSIEKCYMLKDMKRFVSDLQPSGARLD